MCIKEYLDKVNLEVNMNVSKNTENNKKYISLY